MAIGHMVTYAILGAVIRMSWESGNVYDVNWRIRSGDVIGELTKPINWQLSTTAELLGDTAAQLLILTVVVLVPAGVLFGLQGPVSPIAGIVFLVSLLLGLLIYSGITFLLVLLAFRVVYIHGYQLALFNISCISEVRSCLCGSTRPGLRLHSTTFLSRSSTSHRYRSTSDGRNLLNGPRFSSGRRSGS